MANGGPRWLPSSWLPEISPTNGCWTPWAESRGTNSCRHELQRLAYDDRPLPIGHGQTISQPYIVALMTQLVDPKPEAKALDVGTGSGYQAAVLAELAKDVYSIEIVAPLADEARRRLQSLGYQNIEVRHGDGYRGWPEKRHSTSLSWPRRRIMFLNLWSSSLLRAAKW